MGQTLFKNPVHGPIIKPKNEPGQRRLVVFALDKATKETSSHTSSYHLTRKATRNDIDRMNKNKFMNGNDVEAIGSTTSRSDFPAKLLHTETSVLAPTSQSSPAKKHRAERKTE